MVAGVHLAVVGVRLLGSLAYTQHCGGHDG
jgi:hypothetical protein